MSLPMVASVAARSSEEASSVRPAAGRPPLRAAALAVFLLGSLWGIFYLHHSRLLYYDVFYEEPDIAEHLARGEGFLSPMVKGPAAPPTSWSAPLYPCLTGAVYRVLGVETRAATAVMTSINAVCLAATATGLFLLGARLFWPVAGALAALLALAHPMFLRWTCYTWDSFVAMALFTWCCVATAAIRRAGATGWRLAGLGALLGVLVLANSSYALALPVLVIAACAAQRWGRRLALWAIAAAACMAVLTPWTVRNYRTFHKLFFIRGGAWLEAMIGDQEDSTGWLTASAFTLHPYSNPAEIAAYLKLGEMAYFDTCRARFLDSVRRHPARYAVRSVHRLGYLFLSDPTEPVDYPLMPNWEWRGYIVDRVLLNAGLAMLGIAGAWMAWRLGWRAGWVAAAALAASAPFIFVHVFERYTFPLRALLALGAAFAVAALLRRLRRGAWPRAQPVAVAAEEAEPVMSGRRYP